MVGSPKFFYGVIMLIRAYLSFALLFSAFSTFAIDRYEVVSQVDGDHILAMDVEEYVDSFVISPGIESVLRAKALQEGSRFEEEKKKLIDHIFLPTLEKMTLIRLLQKNAILLKDRQFFSLSKEKLDWLVDMQVKKIISRHKKDGLSESEAKDEIISHYKNLSKNNQGLTESELWQNYTNKIRYTLQERYRESEAFRYLCTLGNCEKESPFVIFKKNVNRFKRNHFVQINNGENIILKNKEAFEHILRSTVELESKNGEELSENTRPRRFLFLGEIISNKVEFRHINDWDLTSGLAPILVGYPKTDDQGRTSGLGLFYDLRGSSGSLSIELENFLFSRKISSQDRLIGQEIEEDSSLRVVSRQFLDESGKKWILLGVSAGHRTQTAGVHSFIQSAFHTLNPATSGREYLDRDQTTLSLQGIIGIGGKYSLIDTKHVDLIFGGEAFINPTLGLNERSSFTVRSSVDLNVSGDYEQYPILSLGLFGEYSFLINGTKESVLGGKVSFGKVFRNVYYQASLFVVKWDRDLDRAYEGGASWTTGLSVSATFINRKPKVSYVFN